jgi:hypothetical protein
VPCPTYHKPVRGWVILEGYPRPDVWRFVAHSVVEDERGRLFDLTPNRAGGQYRFLRDHRLSNEEFILMLSRRQLVWLDHRMRSVAPMGEPARVR